MLLSKEIDHLRMRFSNLVKKVAKRTYKSSHYGLGALLSLLNQRCHRLFMGIERFLEMFTENPKKITFTKELLI